MPESPVAPSLKRFFDRLVRRSLEDLRMGSDPAADYLAGLLARFSRTDQLYALRGTAGERLETVVEMLLEVQRSWEFDQPHFDPFRERDVRQHIGDYTLFMTGLFPEFLARQARSGLAVSRDAFLDHVRTGKRSYWVVSEFTLGTHGSVAPLFRKLSENFELCVYGLGHVRAELDRLRDPAVRRVWGSLVE